MATTQLALLAIMLISFSGFFLKYLVKFDISSANCRIPIIFGVIGILASTQLRNFPEAIIFFLATIGQFMAYVFVSRLRQRGSFFWHAMASIGSNGMWFITLHILNSANAYWLLFLPYVIGIIAGRIAGVNWAQFVEHKYQLKGDATRDDKLKPGQRLNYIKKEPTFWVLAIILVGYVIYGNLHLAPEINRSVMIVIGLGILQNFFYALSTRASARGNNWYIALTGIFSGLTFYVSSIFLLINHMSFFLITPYIIGTTLGSTVGAFISMVIEWIMQLKPDAHLDESNCANKNQNNLAKHLPYVSILTMGTVWVLFHESIFRHFNLPLNTLRFPISTVTGEFPRSLIMLFAAILFLLDSALQTIASRAGNRNHTGYHVTSLIPKGFTDFFRVSYLSLNSNIPDIVPVAILSGCLGSLYGKDISQKIERWLEARMDIEQEKPKPKLSSA